MQSRIFVEKMRHFLWLSVCQLHLKNRRDRWQVCTVADDSSRRSLSPLSFLLLQFFCREERIVQFFCLLSEEHITSSLLLFLLPTRPHSCLSAVYLFFWLWQFCPEERESYSPLPRRSRKPLLLSIALLTTPHSVRLWPVSLYCLSPSLFSLAFSSQHHGHHAGADGATCAESSKVAGSDAGAIGSRRQRLHQRCHPFAGSFNSSFHYDY